MFTTQHICVQPTITKTCPVLFGVPTTQVGVVKVTEDMFCRLFHTYMILFQNHSEPNGSKDGTIMLFNDLTACFGVAKGVLAVRHRLCRFA